jgi:hypothetical protein
MVSNGQGSVSAFVIEGAGKRVIDYGCFLLEEHSAPGEMPFFSLSP